MKTITQILRFLFLYPLLQQSSGTKKWILGKLFFLQKKKWITILSPQIVLPQRELFQMELLTCNTHAHTHRHTHWEGHLSVYLSIYTYMHAYLNFSQAEMFIFWIVIQKVFLEIILKIARFPWNLWLRWKLQEDLQKL